MPSAGASSAALSRCACACATPARACSCSARAAASAAALERACACCWSICCALTEPERTRGAMRRNWVWASAFSASCCCTCARARPSVACAWRSCASRVSVSSVSGWPARTQSPSSTSTAAMRWSCNGVRMAISSLPTRDPLTAMRIGTVPGPATTVVTRKAGAACGVSATAAGAARNASAGKRGQRQGAGGGETVSVAGKQGLAPGSGVHAHGDVEVIRRIPGWWARARGANRLVGGGKQVGQGQQREHGGQANHDGARARQFDGGANSQHGQRRGDQRQRVEGAQDSAAYRGGRAAQQRRADQRIERAHAQPGQRAGQQHQRVAVLQRQQREGQGFQRQAGQQDPPRPQALPMTGVGQRGHDGAAASQARKLPRSAASRRCRAGRPA